MIKVIRKKGDVDIKNLKLFNKHLSNFSVTVGVHKEEGQKTNFWTGTKVIDYACYNEFGHEGKPPERSFVRRVTKDKDVLDDIKKTGLNEFKKISRWHYKDKGGELTKKLYSKIGTVVLKQMQYYFDDSKNIFLENAESTIKRKHTDYPLIDTGLLASSIKAKIRGKNGGVVKIVKSASTENFKPRSLQAREAQS